MVLVVVDVIVVVTEVVVVVVSIVSVVVVADVVVEVVYSGCQNSCWWNSRIQDICWNIWEDSWSSVNSPNVVGDIDNSVKVTKEDVVEVFIVDNEVTVVDCS